jgi:hypothetical protein
MNNRQKRCDETTSGHITLVGASNVVNHYLTKVGDIQIPRTPQKGPIKGIVVGRFGTKTHTPPERRRISKNGLDTFVQNV